MFALTHHGGTTMASRLHRVEDWIAVAMKHEFCLEKMAHAFNVSERTLRRHFQERFGLTAREWRDRKRLEIALASLSGGDQVKSTSCDTRFKHRTTLTAFIKRQTGSPPSDFRR
jgi:AraC-like DNA-binding protein